MKYVYVFLLMVMSSLAGAQTFTAADSLHYEIDEEYLVNLFKQADVIFCKVDDVDDFIYVKNMEVAFNVDSSLFCTAYLVSNFYGSTITSFYPLWCTSVELNDINGHVFKLALKTPIKQLEFDQQPLNDLDILKPILDSLLQKTDTVDYSKDTRIFLEMDKD